MRTRKIVFLAGTLSCLAACQQTKTAAGGAGNPPDRWRDTFAIDKSRLVASGSSAYLSLQPGTVRTYRSPNGVLTISILDQTEVVDGVTTRVLEEREEIGGKLVEVSRNFLALDPATGDIYYFGEDVDNYKDGKIVSHDSAWRSGVNGARFGLFLPGTPRMGDRYYQEIAPGVAMDRVEVAAVDERFQSAAGNFERCLHLKETTPLESGTSHKVFAPGIGLVRDDEFLLASAGPR